MIAHATASAGSVWPPAVLIVAAAVAAAIYLYRRHR